MASIPLENSSVSASVGSIARLFGLVAAGIVLIEAAMVLGFRKLHSAHLVLASFVIWSAWTYLWSVNPTLTSERLTTNFQLLVLVWVIWQSVRNDQDLRTVLKGFVLGSCCAAILIFVNSHDRVAYDGIRYSAAGADPNELGLTLVISMVAAYYLAKTASTASRGILWLIPLPLSIIGVILTVSRAAFITTTVALAGISIWHITTATRKRFVPIIIGIFLLAAGTAFVPKANLERLGSIESEISSGRVGKRTQLWKAGLQLFQQSPIVGTGAATFAYAAEPIIGRDLAAHNTYVSVLTETGIVGFFCFALALIICASMAARLSTNERFLWLTVMSVWGIGVFSLTFEYKKATWMIFGLLIATAGASRTGELVPRTWKLQPRQQTAATQA